MCQQPEIDKEGITEEERYMLRKIGLRMDPFLLMGELMRCSASFSIENICLQYFRVNSTWTLDNNYIAGFFSKWSNKHFPLMLR